MKLIAMDVVPADDRLEVGGLLTAVAVCSVNVVRDFRENIRNLTGGVMTNYERLLQTTLQRAIADLEQQAAAQGYDGVIGFKIAHPQVVDSCAEILVYGNGFRYRPPR